jgi:hypothetical protein
LPKPCLFFSVFIFTGSIAFSFNQEKFLCQALNRGIHSLALNYGFVKVKSGSIAENSSYKKSKLVTALAAKN